MPAPANLVHQTSATTGTGNLTLAAVNGKQSFAAAFSTGGTDVFDYFISNRDAAEWERGTGHMSDSTTLVRDTVIESTNANAAVNFSAGTKDVVNDIPAANQVTLDGANTWSAQQTFSAALALNSGQINFPATQNASADANVLDDYEEGTFTPAIAGTTAAGAGTYTTQDGAYTKIGRMVFVSVVLVWTAHTGTGNIKITGLPFTSLSTTVAVGSIRIANLTYTGPHVQAVVSGSSTDVSLEQPTSGGNAAIPMDTAATVWVSIAYMAA